jgi:hypothetical protein
MFRRGPKADPANSKKSKPTTRANKNDPDSFDPTQFGVQAIADDDPDLLAELAGRLKLLRMSACSKLIMLFF